MYTKEQMARFAYEQIPYYNNLYNMHRINVDDKGFYSKIPVVSKECIKKYGVVNFVNIDQLNPNYQFLNKDNMVTVSSSGTTGEPMDIVWTKKDYLSSMLNHWVYRLKNYSITPGDKFFSSRRLKYESEPYIIKSDREIIVNTNLLSDTQLESIFSKMQQIEPGWLMIQPSVMYLLSNYVESRKLCFPKSIKYIEFYAEPLIPYYLNQIKKVINCRMSNMYGCSETNGIAYECSAGKMHIMTNNVHVEVINKRGKPVYNREGNICVTGLHNTNMPMVRYMLNDRAILRNELCNCGTKGLTLELINARIPEFIIFDDLSYCKEGALFFPYERAGIIPMQHDIRFSLQRYSLREYSIVFNRHDSQRFSMWQITSAFRRIMNNYGVKNCNFVFDFSNDIDDRFPKGLLRI